ncbi:MAG: DoxX family protein [Acidimicrobiales bacterium]
MARRNRAGKREAAMKSPVEMLGDPAAVETPRVLQFLTRSRIMGVGWSAMRIWLGVMWIQAGVSKLWGAENPAFLHHNGAGVAGFATHAAAAYSWWGSFLHSFVVPNSGWIGVVVSLAEFLVGIGLAIGFLTPAAALGGLLLNFTYVMSGTASVNAFYALFAVVILATWRTSGMIGVDGIASGYLQRHREGREAGSRRHGLAGIVGHAQAA